MSGERWEQILADRLESQAADVLETTHQFLLERISSQCESPIEAIFAASLAHIYDHIAYDESISWRWRKMSPASMREDLKILGDLVDAAPLGLLTGGGKWTGLVSPQATCGKYRVDFLFGAVALTGGKPHPIKLLAVECDGHEFHERTKEQAERDKSRDRELQASGIAVFRFTGSKIYQDPGACVDEVVEFFSSWAESICDESWLEVPA